MQKDLIYGPSIKNFKYFFFSPSNLSVSYPSFGSVKPGRNYSTANYRFGYQGQEKDDEIKGEGNSINYTFRMHDPRIGRFFAIDPLTKDYPWYSPYQYSGNKVIQYVELEGLEEGIATSMMVNNWEKQDANYNAGKISYSQLVEQRTRSQMAVGLGGTAGTLAALLITYGKRYILEEIIEELAGFPIIPDPGDAIQSGLRKMSQTPPTKARPGLDLVTKRIERESLAAKRMGSKAKTQYVDLDKPVYDKTFDADEVLYQYRRPGTEEGAFFVKSKDITPEQVGLSSKEYSEVYKVTLNQKTTGMVSSHKKNTTYFRDNSVKVEGGGQQIYAPKINGSSATFVQQ